VNALIFERVCAGYGGRQVLRDIGVNFSSGKVTGLVGPNGAGKTTLLRLAVRLVEPESGDISVLERRLMQWPAQSLARTVAYLPQNQDAHWPIEVRRLVALGRIPYRPSFAPLSVADERAVDDALARCDAWGLAKRPASELSAGERARVLLARALAVVAPVLLVDEPAAHLDPSHQLRLMELLRAEAARGTAVVVTLHDLSLASRFCDDIVVLHEGSVVAQGLPEHALDDSILQNVFAVRARRIEGRTVVPWQGV
jgi:iron complex transport system ATP-binding protein